MRCLSCDSDNPDGAKFCIEGAAPLQQRCPSCGAENLPRAKFCGECATPLVRQLSVASSQLPVASPQHPAPNPSTQAQAEAEACFLKAIDIARRQSAKSLELRAGMSLARLWQQQGKKE